MRKLLLYLVMAVVTSLSVTQPARATPYDCTSCAVPFDIRNSLYGYMYNDKRLDNPYSFTGDISDNNEAAWDAVVWTDGLRSKPSFEDLTNSFIHDYGAQYRAMGPYIYDASSSIHGDISSVQTDISILTGDVAAVEAAVEALPSSTQFADMETDLAGKMDAPAGTTGQYVRGDGSLATFPTVPDAQVQSDWAQGSSGSVDFIKNKPTLGTAAQLNVAAAGDAGTGEVVKGNDTRLTNSRTPSAHTHTAGDVTSGTFADGRISQSSVTQHQAALSIGASQVTGTKTSSFVSDFAEAAQDNALGVVTAGAGLSYTYNDAGNSAVIGLASKTYQSPTFSSATSATRLSTTVDADVFYSFDATVTISLLAGQSVTAVLKYADDSGMSSNVVTVDSAKTANSGVLNLTQTNTLRVGGKIPAGKYRQVTFTTAGSGVSAPSAIAAGQEVF
jgi:hypothetical protein